MKIGILSDTHGYWDERYAEHFAACDEIWHCGDIGSEEVLQRLQALKPVRAVYGNIDAHTMRARLPRHQRFTVGGVEVWITHIGGYPGKYAPEVTPAIFVRPPKLFVCGHSHILKVSYDKTLQLLHINPGAAGKYGFHAKRTLVRLSIENGTMSDLEVIELAEK